MDDWRQGYGNAAQLETLADHLGLVPDERLRKAALHTMCKTGPFNGKPYHWTPYIAIDIDMRDHHSTESLRERYERCVDALGTTPVVLRSPGKVLPSSPHHDGHAFGGHGLHLYFPLQVPVSIFGLTCTKVDSPVLVPTALQAEGITVRSAWVEVYPTSTHTRRMPLAWGMAQLNSETLMPLPTLTRADEVARLVESMDATATSALDPFALAERLRQPRRSRVCAVSNEMGITPATAAPNSARAGVHSIGGVDVERLEQEGLYPGVTRNEAALALARRRMLQLGLSAADTVEFLMDWSATMHNGLSNTAARLPCPEATRRLRKQYERITRSILKAIAIGKVVAGGGRRTGRPITEAEVRWIMQRTSAITEPVVRYSVEVFLTCIIGFAKDRGRVAIGPARFEGADLIHAQIPATTMQRWPRCGSGQYRRWLTWAEDSEFTRMVRNYGIRKTRSGAARVRGRSRPTWMACPASTSIPRRCFEPPPLRPLLVARP